MLPDSLRSVWMTLLRLGKMRSDQAVIDLTQLVVPPDPDVLEQLRKLGYYQPIDENTGIVRVPY